MIAEQLAAWAAGFEPTADDVALANRALDDGATLRSELELPPGAPQRPPSREDLAAKVADCAGDLAFDVLALGWAAAPDFLRELQPVTRSASPG